MEDNDETGTEVQEWPRRALLPSPPLNACSEFVHNRYAFGNYYACTDQLQTP